MQAERIANTLEMTHDEWLQMRNTGITGSRIAAIMGKNPYETPLSIYLRMKGQLPEKEQSEAMYFGTVLEDFIAGEFAKRTGLEIAVEPFMLKHPTYDFMLANVDRIVTINGKPGVLECKNVSAYQWDVWKAGAPEQYIYQLQWYLGITGYEYGFLCALVGGQKLIYHEYARDDDLIREMFKAATDFWFNHIESDVQPDVSAGDGGVLDELYSEPNNEWIAEIASEQLWLVQQCHRRKADKELAEEQYDESVNAIKNVMGNAETLSCDGEIVATWKANKKGIRSFKLVGGAS